MPAEPEKMYLYIYIYEVEHSREELPVATHVMQRSSNELSTPVAIKCKCKKRKNNTYMLNSFAYSACQ